MSTNQSELVNSISWFGQIVHFCISNQFGNILIPFFTVSCRTSFCLQSTVTECLILFFGPLIYLGGVQFIWLTLLHLQYNHIRSSYKVLKTIPPKHLLRICQPNQLFLFVRIIVEVMPVFCSSWLITGASQAACGVLPGTDGSTGTATASSGAPDRGWRHTR